jgi:hypothetical protein
MSWIGQAISTYVLHVEHGNGYQWWSGFGGRTLGASAVLGLLWHRYNCHESGCWRPVRHGKHYCPKHEEPEA